MSRETLHFVSYDDAVAEALRGAGPGDVIEIHSKGCEGQEEINPPYDIIGCTCRPMVLTAGAQA